METSERLPPFADGVRKALNTFSRRHPRLTAAAPLVVLAPAGLPFDLYDHPATTAEIATAWTLWPLAFVPLVWRRKHPLPVFAVVAIVFAVEIGLRLAEPSVIALLCALYSLARYGPLRALAPTAILAYLEMLGVAARWIDGPGLAETIFLMGAAVTAAASLGLGARILRAHLAGLEERAVRLETERDQRARLAAVTERARIAREMHDVIGHHLAVIVSLADGGGALSRTAPRRGTEALENIAGLGRQALGELRSLLGVLTEHGQDAELTPQPGLADLGDLLAQVGEAGLPVSLTTSGTPDDLPTGVQIAIYRIVQEALTNTLKHAGPDATGAVRLTCTPTRVELLIENTGRSADAPVTDGLGLAGIRERAAVYGGTARGGPRPGGGWLVTATFGTEPA
ncbi:sensor histidine kinase [Actinomadura rayongensis]|uniref:histidine kinase n=1 Tax=Actinomadura rayongensis TaxID=1429076 RepID=A0A6I4WIE0_9ACTN|nr:histidine kinase [Actinomadura rayongensis]MXQ67526.1 sensor histidine kinase [Actinomadura rayongensis]